MLSAMRMVERRCALTNRVTASPATLSITRAWLLLSSQFVASSRNSTTGSRASAAANMMRCTWPPENSALSPTGVCICIGMAAMSSSTAARRAARQASSSVKSVATPMMFSNTVPGCIEESCATMPILLRTARLLRRPKSRPS